MEQIIEFSATAKTMMIFILMVSVIAAKIPAGLAFLGGALLTGVLNGVTFSSTLYHIAEAFLQPQTILLNLAISLIILFNRLLELTGSLKRMVSLVEQRLGSKRLASAALPALIGLLPMPGGAVFSAPMVKTSLQGMDIEPERKIAINYWFRHVWEYWWPLYPGMILAATLADMVTWRFILITFLYTPISLVAGWLFIMPRPDREYRASPCPAAGRSVNGKLLSELAPIFMVVVIFIFCSVLFSPLLPKGVASKILPIITGLAVTLLFIMAKYKLSVKTVSFHLFSKQIGLFVLMVSGLMAFRNLLEISGVMTMISQELQSFGIPIVPLLAILPLFAGMVTGIAIGFVGLSFPIILMLISKIDTGFPLESIVTMSYAFGYMGMIFSPVHICFVITSQYFSGSLFRSMRFLVGPALSVLITAVGLLFLFRIVFG